MSSIYIFNPIYTLFNDRKRILMCNSPVFQIKPEDGDDDIVTYMHPVFAVILSLFDGIRTINNVQEELSSVYGIEEVSRLIGLLIENAEEIGINYDSTNFIFPKRVLIPFRDEVHSVRQLNPKNYILRENLDFKTSRLFKAPISLTVQLNTTCFVDCEYCYVDRSKIRGCEIPFSRLKEIILEARKLGIVNFDISGTEIFMYEHWYELLVELRSSGYYPYISTKKPIGISEIDKLLACGIKELQISIDTIDFNNSKKMLRINGEKYVSALTETLKLLESAGIKVKINTVLTKTNSSIEDLMNLFNLINKFSNIIELIVNPASCSIDKKGEKFNAFKVSTHELAQLEEKVSEWKHAYKFNVGFADFIRKEDIDCFEKKSKNFQSRSICTANTTQMCILCNGQVTICEELYWEKRFIIGDILHSSISEIWNSNDAKELYDFSRTQFSSGSACRACQDFVNCRNSIGVCWSNVIMAYGEDKWDYPAPDCPKAPKPYFTIHHD